MRWIGNAYSLLDDNAIRLRFSVELTETSYYLYFSLGSLKSSAINRTIKFI